MGGFCLGLMLSEDQLVSAVQKRCEWDLILPRLCSMLLFVPSGRIRLERLIHARLLRDAPREHRPHDLPQSQFSSRAFPRSVGSFP